MLGKAERRETTVIWLITKEQDLASYIIVASPPRVAPGASTPSAASI